MEQMDEVAVTWLSQILQSMGYEIHGRFVMIATEDGADHVTVGGKKLVVPNRECLKISNWQEEIPFNPLCENTLRGESEVQQEMTVMIRAALNIRLATLVWRLGQVAGSEQCKENKLSNAQSEFLPCLPGFDANMQKNLGKIALGVNPEHYKTSLIHLNLKRRSKIDGHQWDRACLVRFPLAEMERKEKPFGVTLRVNDMDALNNLLDYILPEWQVENKYSRGTDSKVAPYFLALLMSYQAINARITEIAKIFVADFPHFGALVNEDLWVDGTAKMAQMRDSLPSLEGNEGVVEKGSNSLQAPQIKDPTPARAMGAPVPSAGSMPWDEQPAPAAQPAAAPAARTADSDTVEYVPRQHAQPGQIPFAHAPVAAPLIPAGYGNNQPQAGSAATFQELQRQRMQQTHGHNYAASYQEVPVGGSPFAGGGNPAAQPVPQSQYSVSYMTPGAHLQTQAPPTGRGF